MLDENHAVGGVVDIGVEAGDDFVAIAVDEAALVVVEVDLAVVAVEFVDKTVFVWYDDGAVLPFETEEFALLGSLNAVDEDEFTSTGFVVDVLDSVLRSEEGWQGKTDDEK